MTGNRFEACLAKTLRHEGYYSDDPFDPGGATMQGVTQRVYDAWRERNGRPRRAVKQLERAELEAIYRENYWNVIRGDDLPEGVDFAVFDFAVNSGPSRAARHLQAVLGVNVDGHIGDVTIGAARRADSGKVISDLCQSRLGFVRSLKTWWRFGRGWSRRINDVKTSAMAIATADVIPADDVQPVPSVGKATSTSPKTMAGSKTGNAAAGITLASVVALALTLMRLIDSELADGSFSLASFLAACTANVEMMATLSALVASLFGNPFIWLERRAKLVEERV